MLIHTLTDSRDSSWCTLTFDEAQGWLRAAWGGYVDPDEAREGAAGYLQALAQWRCPYLLNDNTALRGPWFDSVEWLAHVWLPQARQHGLRYVAHVVQADTGEDLLSLTFPNHLTGHLELQLFHHLHEAEEWLRTCQAREKTP